MDDAIVDVQCPRCDSFDTNIYSTDEIEFYPDGTGHYYADMICRDCRHAFRMCYNFTYQITKSWVRG